jgi:hypothetical protein
MLLRGDGITDVYHQTIHRSLQTTPTAMWKASMDPEDSPLPGRSPTVANLDLAGRIGAVTEDMAAPNQRGLRRKRDHTLNDILTSK